MAKCGPIAWVMLAAPVWAVAERPKADLAAIQKVAAKAPPLPKPAGPVVRVGTARALYEAARTCKPGTTILLAGGVYELSRPVVIAADRITLRGAGGDREKVILDRGGGRGRRDACVLVAGADDVLIADLTCRDCDGHGIQIAPHVGAQRTRIHNVKFHNIWTRGVKGSHPKYGHEPIGPDREEILRKRPTGGEIRYCLFVNDHRKKLDDPFRGDYVGGIDMMWLKGWVIADNVFVGIRGRNGGGRGAIFIWVHSEDVVVERNVIIDCDRGICFGNPSGSRPHMTRGMVRNNFVVGGAGKAVEMCRTVDTRVCHNTVAARSVDHPLTVHFFQGARGGQFHNNIVHGRASLEAGVASGGNIVGDCTGWFANRAVGDLHLTDKAARALGAGRPLKDVPQDFDGQKRASPPAVGADEPAGPPPFGSTFVKMTAPEKLLTDQPFPAKFTFRNMGTETWREGASNVKLVSTVPAGQADWGTRYVILGQGRKIAPGMDCAFSSWLRAPSKPGEYAFRWRVARTKGGTLFGESTREKTIVVEARPKEPEVKPRKQDPKGRHVLVFEDFEYAGSFKVPPAGTAGGDPIFASAGIALRRMSDGTRRMFMQYFRGKLFEAEIPELVKLKDGNHKALRTAVMKTVWGELQLEKKGEPAISPNAGRWWDEQKKILYWSSYHGYWTGKPWPLLAASKRGADGRITHYGPWRVPGSMRYFKSFWGGVTRLPAGFAEKYTGGRTFGLGFGGYYSICASTSQGPALAASAEPDPAEAALDAIPLLLYPWNGGHPAPRDGHYLMVRPNWGGQQPESRARGTWTMCDHVGSGVFIDAPRGHAFVAFASLGTGRMGYDYGAIRRAGAANWWYVYDPEDLGKVAQGKKKPWEVAPFAREKMAYPSASPDGELTAAPVVGACYDNEERVLYLFNQRAIGNRFPCVHAYHVKGLE